MTKRRLVLAMIDENDKVIKYSEFSSEMRKPSTNMTRHVPTKSILTEMTEDIRRLITEDMVKAVTD